MVFGSVCLGLGMLLFVAQFLDFLSTTMAMLVLVALVHGVYVVRSGRGPASRNPKVVGWYPTMESWIYGVYIYIIYILQAPHGGSKSQNDNNADTINVIGI